MIRKLPNIGDKIIVQKQKFQILYGILLKKDILLNCLRHILMEIISEIISEFIKSIIAMRIKSGLEKLPTINY